jgi:hypothetical protein
MGYSAKEVRKKTQLVRTGFETISVSLSATGSDVVELACPASKVTVQSTGSLVFDWSVSVNGEDYVSAGSSIAAGALSSYNTHNVSAVTITWVSGTGQVCIAAVS